MSYMKNLSLLLLSLFLFSCASLTEKLLKDPEVQVLGLAISNVSAEDLSVDVKLNIQNPNAIAIDVSKITYGLNFSGQNVTEGVFDKGLHVPAQGVSEVIVPLKFKYNSMQSLVDGFLKKALTKDYELKGSVDLGYFSIPFSKIGRIEIKR